jgi:hypothetical protein
MGGHDSPGFGGFLMSMPLQRQQPRRSLASAPLRPARLHRLTAHAEAVLLIDP